MQSRLHLFARLPGVVQGPWRVLACPTAAVRWWGLRGPGSVRRTGAHCRNCSAADRRCPRLPSKGSPCFTWPSPGPSFLTGGTPHAFLTHHQTVPRAKQGQTTGDGSPTYPRPTRRIASRVSSFLSFYQLPTTGPNPPDGILFRDVAEASVLLYPCSRAIRWLSAVRFLSSIKRGG